MVFEGLGGPDLAELGEVLELLEERTALPALLLGAFLFLGLRFIVHLVEEENLLLAVGLIDALAVGLLATERGWRDRR